jgi:hypothetical protein
MSWRTDYPTDLEELITSRYKLAVVVTESDAYIWQSGIHEDANKAIHDYLEMRSLYREECTTLERR